MKAMTTAIILGIVLILVAIALFYGTGKFLIIAVLAGIVSGTTGYYISQDEILKIVRDDETEIKITSEKASWVIAAFSFLVGVASWDANFFSFTSFMTGLGLLVIVAVVAALNLTLLTNIHRPTHDLRMKK